LHGAEEPIINYPISTETGTPYDSKSFQNEYNNYYDDHGIDDTDTDTDTDIEDFINKMDEEDKNKTTPLYTGCPISLYEACTRLTRLGHLLNLDKNGMQRLLKEIRFFFPSDCLLPKTIFMLFKMTDNEFRPQVFI
jgi:hypothetical protein